MDHSSAKQTTFLEPKQEESLFELLGGRSTLERANKVFYDKIYAHPWLKGFFKDIDQKYIERQQTDYQTMRMGAGNIYSGKLPASCHRHMFINDEMLDLRMTLLRESIRECGVPEHLSDRWLDLVGSTRKDLVKTDPNQCQKRFATDEIIVIPKPV